MGTIKKNLMRQVMTESKIFDVKETSYSEIISYINHMINKVVDGNDFKDHYVINIKKDNHIFIVAGNIEHSIYGKREVSFATINTLNTSTNEIYASKPKDILEEVERRLKEFLENAPQSLEERVSKLEVTVYSNKSNKENKNELVQNIETIQYNKNNLINTLEMLSKYVKKSIDRIYRKEYTGCKKGELILVKRDDTEKAVLFAIYVYTVSCGDLGIAYTMEYENIGDIEDLVCFRSKKQWFSINIKEPVNNTAIEVDLLQNFILKMYDNYIPLIGVKIDNEREYYKFIKLIRDSIVVNKESIAIISCENNKQCRMMVFNPKVNGKYKICLISSNSINLDLYSKTFKEVADDIYNYALNEEVKEK